MPINRMDIMLLMHIEEGPDIPPYYGMPLRWQYGRSCQRDELRVPPVQELFRLSTLPEEGVRG